MMFASWLGLTAFRRMNGVANTSRQRKKGRTILHVEVLEDRWVPSTATGTSLGDFAGNLQSQSYLLNSPTMNSAQTLTTTNPQVLSSNVTPASSVTAIFTPSGSSLPSATQYVSYSTDITAAPSTGSSKLNVGIDPASQQLLNSIGLTAVVTPATETTAGKLTIQGIPTGDGIFSITVVAYREPTEPLGTKTYTLEIAPNSAVDVANITASVSPNSVDAGGSVSVSAKVTDATNTSNIIDGGTVTFTLTGASGTSIRSNPITVANGTANATLTIPSLNCAPSD